MTGTGRAKKQREAAELSVPAPSTAIIAKPDTSALGTVPAPTAEATVPVMPQVDPEDRLAPPRPDEDLLDIPAFLRRQAN